MVPSPPNSLSVLLHSHHPPVPNVCPPSINPLWFTQRSPGFNPQILHFNPMTPRPLFNTPTCCKFLEQIIPAPSEKQGKNKRQETGRHGRPFTYFPSQANSCCVAKDNNRLAFTKYSAGDKAWEEHSEMWMSTLARFARPVFQRSPSPVVCKAMKACRRMELRAPSFCMTPVHIRRHQTLGSAPMPVAAHSMRHVRALDEERLMAVEWEDGGQSLYPFTWLRDNCQCPRCTLQSAEARLLLMADLDIHTGMDSVEVTKDGKVSIVWPDQHMSVFDAEWLKKRCFSDAARQAMQEELFLNERYYWDATLHIPQADFQEVLHDDGAALAWLLALRRVGIVHLKGAPAEQGQVARLAERIGYLRLTFYGHTWQVQDKSMANNVAYTSGKLSLHTDYPALHFAPGVQFLHCINQAKEGGESEAVDGFHMAEQLQREDPEAFRTLTSLHVDFTDTGTDYCDFMLQSKNRIIDVDSEGKVTRINYNNATRDSVLDLPLHQVQPFYRALRAYVDIMNRPENVVTYTMKPGDIVTFDNWRLLHGRKSYISRPDRLRHLEGAYLDWDEVMSRLRIVRRNVHGDAWASDKRSHLHRKI